MFKIYSMKSYISSKIHILNASAKKMLLYTGIFYRNGCAGSRVAFCGIHVNRLCHPLNRQLTDYCNKITIDHIL
jgi:hypothetical protein